MSTAARRRQRARWPVLAAIGALAATAPAQASFSPEGGPIGVGNAPYGVVTTDFNGDGRPDVATVNGTSSNLSVLLRQPGGAFIQESGSPFPLGSGPGYGVAADFNGDGRPDVATGNFSSPGSASVLIRQPAGGFAAEPQLSVASASSVAAADFNGDRKPDLAVTSLANPGSVTTFMRNPANTGFDFEGATTTGANPRDVVAADFNGDGRPDLAITNLGAASVTVLLRNAGSGFTAEGSDIPVGASPEGITAADFNGDGRPDLAVASLGDGGVSILLRQAAGGFAAEGPAIATGAGALGVAAADFNGDGRPDVAVTNNTAGTVSVLLRQAGGGFAPDAGTPIIAPAANGIGTADFNGDGRPDLAVSDGGTTLTVLLNTTPPATPAPVLAPPAPPVAGKSVVVRVVSGTVRIKRPGHRYVALTDAANIPVGSLVDTRKGRVELTSAADTGGKKLQTAQFYDGIFQIKQSVPRKKPKTANALITDLLLRDEIARSQCAPLKRTRSAAVDKKKGPKGVLGKLWGNGKGTFRTTDKYSSATVRGTIWLTQDECDGTLTRVRRGVVSVRDFKRKKTPNIFRSLPSGA
jgi:hypothetical protein